MKKIVFTVFLFGVQSLTSSGQGKAESEIRRLEKLELEAIHKADTLTLLKLWSKDYVVNNPAGKVVTVPEILEFIREGKIDYSSVERIVERVTFTENIAISMGKEIVTPKNAADNSGKKVVRRFTDVWIRAIDSWRLTARQATIVSVE